MAVWGSASKSNLRELQVIQNRCLKVVFRMPFWFPNITLYSDANDTILPIKALHEQQTLTHVHKLIMDPSMHHNIAVRRIQHSRASRQTGNFSLARPNSMMGRKKITFSGFKLHNALPAGCKSARNISIFKVQLRKHIKQKVAQYLI